MPVQGKALCDQLIEHSQKHALNQTGFAGEHKAWKVSYEQRKLEGTVFLLKMRARAVRLVPGNEADYKTRSERLRSISQKIGCNPETLRDWVNKQAIETGEREGLTQSERAKLKELERENRELKQANDILRKASAFFAAADLDRLRNR